MSSAIRYSLLCLREYGVLSSTESWQGIKQPVEMYEYDNLYWRAYMPTSILGATRECKPDLPWAEDHFQERVGGEPLNPGSQFLNWPHYKDRAFNDKNFRQNEIFSHTYMERFWPKHAGDSPTRRSETPIRGIRYSYGDLNDVINLLIKEPHTRQAYLPVWFPEDTGAIHGGRVPCSLGYHFTLRYDSLHVHYTIRACDALRHFRNDVYMAIRLGQFVMNKVNNKLRMGILTMDIINFHVFGKEKNLI